METEKGKLVRWIDDKGFGFIKPESGGAEVFIHISALKTMSRPPVVGDIILYETSLDDKGKLRAINAKIDCNGLMIPDTSKGRLYTVNRGDHDKREKTQTPQIQSGI